MGIVSTLLRLLHRVMGLLSCPASPNSFPLPHLNLPLQPQLHLHLQFRSSHPVGRSPAPPRPLPAPLLIGGLTHRSAHIAPPSALVLARCTTSQEVLWLKDKLLWGGMGVLLPPPLGLRSPRGRLWPSALQRAPLLCVVPHLWWAVLWGRTGERGTVVCVGLYCPFTKLGTARVRSWRSCWRTVGQHWGSLPVRMEPQIQQARVLCLS